MKVEELTDKEIIESFKNDSNKGFNLVLKKYQEKLYWHIRRMVVSHADADDVLQDSFVKIWKNLPKFREDAQLYTWIYRIATNESITFLNKRKKTIVQSSEEMFDLLKSEKSEGSFSGDEIEMKLQQAISTLPEKQKAIFNLRYFEDMKYDDISSVLGTSVGGLKASYHIAVKKIEKFLKSN